MMSSNVAGSDIAVSTDKGIVTLSGNVDSGAERALAIELAQNVEGVKQRQFEGSHDALSTISEGSPEHVRFTGHAWHLFDPARRRLCGVFCCSRSPWGNVQTHLHGFAHSIYMVAALLEETIVENPGRGGSVVRSEYRIDRHRVVFRVRRRMALRVPRIRYLQCVQSHS